MLSDVHQSTWFSSINSLYNKRQKDKVPHGLTHYSEDFCEFCMGMELANEKMRARIARIMTEAQDSDCCSDELKALFKEWIENMLDADKTKELAEKITLLLKDVIANTAKKSLH